MRETHQTAISRAVPPTQPRRTTVPASALLAIALNVPAWVLYLMAREAAQAEFLGGIVEGLLALAFVGAAVLVAGMGVIAASVDSRDRGESVWPSIAVGLVALSVSIGSIVLFVAIPNDAAGIMGP